MKKLLLAIVFSALYVMPVMGQAEAKCEETAVTAAQFEMELQNVTDTVTKYCNARNVNIRLEPNLECEILDQAMISTSFETVLEIDGWTMVTTCNGYAYIKSEYLSNKEISHTYNDEDLYILAHVISGEAQYCSDEEQRYVGSVVLNRVKHSEFPNSIKEVVFQKNQYACTRDGNYYREPTDSNWSNAKWLLENGSVFPDYVIWQSGEKQGNDTYLKTDVHYYCY